MKYKVGDKIMAKMSVADYITVGNTYEIYKIENGCYFYRSDRKDYLFSYVVEECFDTFFSYVDSEPNYLKFLKGY